MAEPPSTPSSAKPDDRSSSERAAREEEIAPGLSAPEGEGAEDEGEPPDRPRKGRRFAGPRPPIRWGRQLTALLGLALCVGCLWTLLGGGPLPGWQPAWPGKAAGRGVAVIIDPGHGGEDSGAVAEGVVEKSLNLDVGLRVAQLLRARGVEVRLTREDDHFVPLEDRVRLANSLPGAVFVSIHFNDASGNGKAVGRASGIETYYCERKLAPDAGWAWASLFGGKSVAPGTQNWAIHEGQTLADCIQGSLIAGTAATDRGIKERSLYVTHRVMGPAVLVEGGFVSNPAEARRLSDTAYRQTIAESIAGGIVKYLGAARQRAPLVATAFST